MIEIIQHHQLVSEMTIIFEGVVIIDLTIDDKNYYLALSIGPHLLQS